MYASYRPFSKIPSISCWPNNLFQNKWSTFCQTIGWNFEIQCCGWALCFSNHQAQLIFGHTLILSPFLVFMWVTAIYFQHRKYQCKFERGWYSIIPKVKTLPENKDKSTASGSRDLSKLQSEAWVQQMLCMFYLFLGHFLTISTVSWECLSN